MLNKYILLYFSIGIALSCKNGNGMHDASGTFEAKEIIVSAEAMGRVNAFAVEEGSVLVKDQEVAVIDGSNLALQKEQVNASVEAINDKQNDAGPQVQVLNKQITSAQKDLISMQTQMNVLAKEQKRIERLFKAEAATSQQMDEIDGKVDVMTKQIEAANSKIDVLKAQIASAKDVVRIQNKGISSEKKPLEKRAAILEDQLKKTKVLNPTNGTLLTKYVNEGEFVNPGKAMYKLADLSEMTLRAYITGDQLSELKLNQTVKVFIDNGKKDYKPYNGIVSWISDKAEFTPKTIQTKEERSNLVYAIKIKVKNDGFLKIGMYGEVELNESKTTK